MVTAGAYVNPIRSKTEQKALSRPGELSGGSLDVAGDGGARQMIIRDITRLIVLLGFFINLV